jgi:hypothetical protein
MRVNSRCAALAVAVAVALGACSSTPAANHDGGGPLPVRDRDDVSSAAFSTGELAPALAVAPDGRLMAAWQTTTDQSTVEIGYRFSDDRGETWSMPGRMPSANTMVPALWPTIAADASGRFYLVFQNITLGVTNASVTDWAVSAPPGAADFAGLFDLMAGPNDPQVVLRPLLAPGHGGAMVGIEALVDTQSVYHLSRAADGAWTTGAATFAAAPTWLCATREDARLWLAASDRVLWSDDDGANFTATGTMLMPPQATALTPRCAAGGGALWTVDNEGAGGLRAQRSGDRGASFDAGVELAAGQMVRADSSAVDGSGALWVTMYVDAGAPNPTVTLTRATAGAAGAPETLRADIGKPAPTMIAPPLRSATVAYGPDVFALYTVFTPTGPHVAFHREPITK